MKVLLDENLPHAFAAELDGHAVHTVAGEGWQGVKNGELLRRAAQSAFDALLTQDKGFAHQHDQASLPLAVVVIRAKSSRIADLRALSPAVRSLLTQALQPRVYEIS